MGSWLSGPQTESTAVPGLTYWETLRCAWRLTWPLAVVVTSAVYVVMAGMRSGYLPQPITTPYVFAGFIILNGVVTFFLLPSLVNRNFRGFSLTLNDGTIDYAGMPITVHTRIWAWVVSRESLACLAAWFLLSPLATLLSLIGVHRDGLILILAFAFGVRPFMMKLLIENCFSGFHLEVRRS